MAILKIDTDGLPYWDQFTGTRIDYTVDWSAYIANVSDTISSSIWSVYPADMAISSADLNGNQHTIFASTSGNNAGSNYVLTSKIFTERGRIDRRSFRIKVES